MIFMLLKRTYHSDCEHQRNYTFYILKFIIYQIYVYGQRIKYL